MGYTGGTTSNPTYRNLGDHTETLEIDYDPAVLDYGQIMDIFWNSHDPFRPSYCSQYAARVFVHNDMQRAVVEEVVRRLEREKGRKVVTEILPYETFYLAEAYHQKYYLKAQRRLIAEFRAIYPDEREMNDSTAVARANGYVGGNGSYEQLKRDLPLLGLSEEAQDVLLKVFQGR